MVRLSPDHCLSLKNADSFNYNGAMTCKFFKCVSGGTIFLIFTLKNSSTKIDFLITLKCILYVIEAEIASQ